MSGESVIETLTFAMKICRCRPHSNGGLPLGRSMRRLPGSDSKEPLAIFWSDDRSTLETDVRRPPRENQSSALAVVRGWQPPNGTRSRVNGCIRRSRTGASDPQLPFAQTARAAAMQRMRPVAHVRRFTVSALFLPFTHPGDRGTNDRSQGTADIGGRRRTTTLASGRPRQSLPTPSSVEGRPNVCCSKAATGAADPHMPFQRPDRLPASRRSCPSIENGRGARCVLALFAA